jgi:hypothetical protein
VFGHFYPADPSAGEEQVDAVLMVSLSKTPSFYRYLVIRCEIVLLGMACSTFKLMIYIPF